MKAKFINRLKAAVITRFNRDRKSRVRCPTIKQMATFIEASLGYKTTIEQVRVNTDRKVGRLRIQGRGRKGNRLIVKHRGRTLLDHNSAETYRHNTDVAGWILNQLENT